MFSIGSENNQAISVTKTIFVFCNVVVVFFCGKYCFYHPWPSLLTCYYILFKISTVDSEKMNGVLGSWECPIYLVLVMALFIGPE
jgi:hypothetical protein